MNILNLFKVSLKAVASNKMRSFLSMLGIIIGVAAVIIMMAIGQGSKESIRAELSTMGTNLLTIRPGADMRGGVRQDPSSMQTLKMADYQRILQEKKFVTKVSPEVTASGQAIYGNNNTTTTVYGESTDYQEMVRLRRTIVKKFPQAFVVAFKDGQRIDLDEAIRQWKANRR